MNRSKASFRTLILLLAIMSLLLSACGGGQNPASPPDSSLGTYAVDLTFREFYNVLGGEKTAGPAISAVTELDGVKLQYTEAAVMRYDPQAEASQQFSLLPVGEDLGVRDAAVVLPEQSGLRIVDGYMIYDEFLELYDALQGERFAGRPLTQVRVNYNRGRIEQYFTNLGFYRRLSDPPGTVRLLAYGAWKCEVACTYSVPPEGLVSSFPVFAEPFFGVKSRLGTDFMGRPLSEPYAAADGMLEQVYENFVVYADPANLRTIGLRPITVALGYAEHPLVPKVDDKRLVFFPLEGELGHLVPAVFEQYITQHGGMEISGRPTTEIFPSGTVYRQCFTNLCLDYDPSAAESLRVRPAPLGYEYLKLHPDLQAAYDNLTQSVQTNRFSVAEAHPMITSMQEQQVTLQVTEGEGQAPVANAEAELTVSRPDGQQATYPFPPTDAGGKATLSLPAVKAANGTLVPYKVCVKSAGPEPECVSDSYLIWGNP